MGRPLGSKNKQPAEGGAVGGGEVDQVRGPIKDMLAGGSDEDFKNSLPETTSDSGDLWDTPLEPKPRKPRKPRAPKEDVSTPIDKRLERAQGKMVGLGAAGLVSAGFTMSGKPLNDEEHEDVDDQFYLISKKVGGNSDSWILIIGYTLALLAKLIILRTEFGEDFQKWLKEMFAERKENRAKQQEPTRQ